MSSPRARHAAGFSRRRLCAVPPKKASSRTPYTAHIAPLYSNANGAIEDTARHGLPAMSLSGFERSV